VKSKKKDKYQNENNQKWGVILEKYDRNNLIECLDQTIQTFLELCVCYTYAMLMLYSKERMGSKRKLDLLTGATLDGHETPQGCSSSVRAISFTTLRGGWPGHSMSPLSDDERETAENKEQNKRLIDL